MSRLFDGVDDVMNYTLTAGTALNDALSMLIVCKIVVTDDTTWLSLLEGERSTGAIGAALGRRSTGNIYFANSSALIDAVAISDADGWMIVAVTRSAAEATNFHKIPIGGSRTTTAGGALADGLTLSGGTMRIGGNDDFANIKVAAAAFWDGTELTTTQLDGIASAKTTQSIDDLNPTWLVDDSDAFATNLTNPGVMDRASIVGTTDDADDPAGWVYGLAGTTKALEVAIAGVGALSPTLTVQTALQTEVSGTGSLISTLALAEALQAAISGTSSLTVAADLQAALNTLVAGQAQIVAGLNAQTALEAAIAGGGTLVADLTIEGQEVVVVFDGNEFSFYSYCY